MDDLTIISTFCKTLTSFCNHLQTSTEALKESIERRPIPLDSASSTFLQHLNRRVSSASNDVELLESMTLGTISFEELLGHCNQFYHKNQIDLLQLQHRFKELGYIPPEVEIDEEDAQVFGLKTPDSKLIKSMDELDLHSCGRSSIMKRLNENPLLDKSLSLQDLGISDVCLATLAASQGDTDIDSPTSFQKSTNYHNAIPFGTQSVYPPAPKVLSATGDNTTGEATTTAVINVSKDDYESLPSFMKTLASWEELNEAIDKMNSILCNQKNSKECNLFHKDKLVSLGLGPKVRSYQLMLLHMHRLAVETVDGSIVYRVL